MALCSTACGSTGVPRWVNGCNITTRKGGISNLVFFTCNWKFATEAEGSVTLTTPTGSTITTGVITDSTSWAIGVQNNMIRISPEGVGEKPESSFTNARLSSCRPEEIASETHIVNFQSFDIDEDNLYDRTYWNTIRTNFGKYKVMYLDCNCLIYYTGDVSDPGFDFVPQVLGYQIPSTYEENSFYQANLAFDFTGIPVPLEVTDLKDALNIDANT